ncbi:hypothetical protein BH10PSE16_BH10PSE16_04550 [soil metagenome]
MRKLLPLFFIALLAGCAVTSAEREARMQQEVDRMTQTYGPICDKLGYKRDTDPWRDCIVKLDTKSSYERMANQLIMPPYFGYYGFLPYRRF